MVNAKHAPKDNLIEKMKVELEKDKRIKVPEWVNIVKAGVHKEKSWVQTDWYHRRLASTLRKVYSLGPIGISRLSAEYGGRADRGSKSYHPERGSRFIVRHMLETLEKLGYVKKNQRGRSIAPAGESFITKAAKEVIENISKDDEKLKKFI